MNRLSVLVPATCLALAASGCGTDAPVVPKIITDPVALYTSLTLNHNAVLMSTAAPYDTLTLVATAYDANGNVMTPEPGVVVTYASSLPASVQVDSVTGLVRALKAASQVQITATLRIGNVVHTNRAYVTVTTSASPPVLTTFSIQPLPPDSTKVGVSSGPSKTLAFHALDADDNPISGAMASFISRDSTVATIDPRYGSIRGLKQGTVTFVGTATVYGVTRTDSVTFTVGRQITGTVAIGAVAPFAFSPTIDTIAVGGTVTWRNVTSTPVDVVFDDPTNVVGGNIPSVVAPFAGYPGTASRKFSAAGSYPYHSVNTGQGGRVEVVAQ
jgi:hypothetical protein